MVTNEKIFLSESLSKLYSEMRVSHFYRGFLGCNRTEKPDGSFSFCLGNRSVDLRNENVTFYISEDGTTATVTGIPGMTVLSCSECRYNLK